MKSRQTSSRRHPERSASGRGLWAGGRSAGPRLRGGGISGRGLGVSMILVATLGKLQATPAAAGRSAFAKRRTGPAATEAGAMESKRKCTGRGASLRPRGAVCSPRPAPLAAPGGVGVGVGSGGGCRAGAGGSLGSAGAAGRPALMSDATGHRGLLRLTVLFTGQILKATIHPVPTCCRRSSPTQPALHKSCRCS